MNRLTDHKDVMKLLCVVWVFLAGQRRFVVSPTAARD